MPDAVPLAKAQLRELRSDFKTEINPNRWITVQFNPETLKVSYANQIVTPAGAAAQGGTASMQYVGAGTTKLSVQLWFDVTVPVSASARPSGQGGAEKSEDADKVDDVRKLTQRVIYFITPKQVGKSFNPPGVRFLWGTFQFDGLMDSLEESLEFFSNDGIPLRASLTLSLSMQKIQVFTAQSPTTSPGARSGVGGGEPGVTVLTQAAAGATLQNIVDSQGQGGNWQAIAAANGVENPRALNAGQLLNLNVNQSSS